MQVHLYKNLIMIQVLMQVHLDRNLIMMQVLMQVHLDRNLSLDASSSRPKFTIATMVAETISRKLMQVHLELYLLGM